MDETLPAHIPKTPPAPGERTLDIARANVEAELERHHADCFAWAMACCGRDRAEAEDVLQTSYLKVLDGRAVFASRSSLKTWLFGVIRRTAAEHRRWRALRRFRPVSLADRANPASDPAAAAGQSESAERLVGALATLTARQQQLLHLVFYQDLTIAEAAGVLGISIGTARTHYERGKQRLREMLTLEDHR
ncbi:MAG TPA: RNA polymerase sigma factor [Gemmatimonadaceae bacterium]|nr:RNA polymerase sigma factor [Gemmatimonadaceae bacterium]